MVVVVVRLMTEGGLVIVVDLRGEEINSMDSVEVS